MIKTILKLIVLSYSLFFVAYIRKRTLVGDSGISRWV